MCIHGDMAERSRNLLDRLTGDGSILLDRLTGVSSASLPLCLNKKMSFKLQTNRRKLERTK